MAETVWIPPAVPAGAAGGAALATIIFCVTGDGALSRAESRSRALISGSSAGLAGAGLAGAGGVVSPDTAAAPVAAGCGDGAGNGAVLTTGATGCAGGATIAVCAGGEAAASDVVAGAIGVGELTVSASLAGALADASAGGLAAATLGAAAGSAATGAAGSLVAVGAGVGGGAAAGRAAVRSSTTLGVVCGIAVSCGRRSISIAGVADRIRLSSPR